jgi:hypothetical protein
MKHAKHGFAVLIAALTLAACASSAEKDAERTRDFDQSERALDASQRAAAVRCSGQAQCDKVWSLTKTYVEQHSDTSIIDADNVAIHTDLPGRNGRLAISATRVAGTSGTTITLFTQCPGMYGPDKAMGSSYDKCVGKITAAQNGFAGYLNGRVSAN